MLPLPQRNYARRRPAPQHGCPDGATQVIPVRPGLGGCPAITSHRGGEGGAPVAPAPPDTHRTGHFSPIAAQAVLYLAVQMSPAE
ncbi:hypothetical protein Srubr_62060 [Streptomyces rubradiris]|uniref:Uncharacterized protein n=1 Tax=Streptomyces rubradiris TaxID=285531 RepID=A0ABQ3RKG4_STRRR|nr:hypothetical protein GCM10018792_69960 [Streptomyces rubradiris]GHI56360.1 hypothetical protein Srubr_62060 [Streptomyces rubradiris]